MGRARTGENGYFPARGARCGITLELSPPLPCGVRTYLNNRSNEDEQPLERAQVDLSRDSPHASS